MPRITLVATVLAAVVAHGAHAAPPNVTYVVTRTDDPVPDGCRPTDCSLREAVTESGRYPTHDIVQLGTGTYILKSTLSVRNSMTITGVGAGSTRITTTAALYPALQIDEATPMWFGLRDLSLNASGGYELRGLANSCITLDGVDLPNAAAKVWIEDAYGCGTTIRATHVAGSVVVDGAIDVIVEDSTFGKLSIVQDHAGNPTPYTTSLERVTVDGATYASSSLRIDSLGDVELADVTVRDTRYGFVVAGDSPGVVVDRLTYTGNSEPVEISGDAAVLLRDSTFARNVALVGAAQPGALWVHGAGAIVGVDRSTFERNSGTADAGGAALVENGAALVITQSTFSGNTFSTAIAASGPRGGAVGYRGSPAQTILRLIGTTVVAPEVFATGINGSAIGGYGSAAQAQLRIYNSIVQGSCASGLVLDHAEGNVGTGDDRCHFDAAMNIVHATKAALALGTLGDHGGPTFTYLPAAGSIAIDAGTDYGCLSMPVDQRGYARRSGSACDAGAVEAGSAAP